MDLRTKRRSAIGVGLLALGGCGGAVDPVLTDGGLDLMARDGSAIDRPGDLAAPVGAPDLAFDAAPTGPQFYVALVGDDANPGTAAKPWRTIQKAMDAVPAGATVHVRAGTYTERLNVGVSGAPGLYTTFQPDGFTVPQGGCGGYTGVACGGDQVILDYGYLGVVSDGIPFLRIQDKSYIRIQGITFQRLTTLELNFVLNQGVRIDGASDHVEIAFNKFLDNTDTGKHDGTSALAHFRVWGPASQIWIHGNEFGRIVTNYGEALTADLPTQSSFLVEDNWIHDTDGIGIDAHGGAHDYAIRKNRLEYISKKRDGTVWYGNPAVAIYNDGGNTGVIERNFVSYAGVAFEALSEPNQPNTHDVSIRDNIAIHCETGTVIGTWYSDVDGSTVAGIDVSNNTFYRNTTGVVIRPMVSATVKWKNNLFADNGTSYVNLLGWPPGDADYNLYFNGGGGPGQHQLTVDPQFTNPATEDFTLKGPSPALGFGDASLWANQPGAVDFAGHPRVVAGRVDLGAYQAQ